MENREITREDYRYGYQGQFSEKDLTTGWNEFELRMYDARIGRWISPDPYGQFASPYVGMGNSFVLGIDPDGGWWCCGGATATTIASGAGPAIGGAAAAVAAASSIWGSLANTLTSVATHVGDRLGNGAVKTGNDIKQAYLNSGYFANSALHTITFGTWKKWEPASQQQEYLQSAGQGFGEGVHVASAVGGGLNPRPSPVLVTPNGTVPVPVTQPAVVPLTRIADVHGRVNAAKLPTIDATGKVHGTLPKVQVFGKYSKGELRILLEELKLSVKKRIEVTSRLGRDRAHGQRQGAEQDLIKSLEKYLSQ